MLDVRGCVKRQTMTSDNLEHMFINENNYHFTNRCYEIVLDPTIIFKKTQSCLKQTLLVSHSKQYSLQPNIFGAFHQTPWIQITNHSGETQIFRKNNFFIIVSYLELFLLGPHLVRQIFYFLLELNRKIFY